MPEPAAPADLVVTGALVATCDEQWSTFDGGGIAVRGEQIVAVGTDRDLQPRVGPETRLIDGSRHLLIPGLINLHCHAGDSLFRGLIENLPLEEWLQLVWRAERAILDESTTELGSALGFAENLLAGTTTVMDMFWYTEHSLRGALSVGSRVATGGILFDLPGMDELTPDQRLPVAENLLAEYADEPNFIGCVMPHGTYTTEPETLRGVRDLLERTGALFSTHAAETLGEQDTVMERYGRRVVEHLAELGLLGPRSVLAHCVHLDGHEIELLARSGTTVAHNPVSNLKLGSGVAPIPELLAAGVRVGLGTDGAISGNDTDLWMALRLAAILHKGVRQDASCISVQQALRMVTLDAAAALGLENQLGSLEVGKTADFVTLRLDRAHAAPLFDPHNHLVYAAGRGDVDGVWVAGQPVVLHGRLQRRDLDDLLQRVRELQPRIEESSRVEDARDLRNA